VNSPVIALRRLTPADERFVAAVYASSREDELRAAGMSGAMKEAFLRQQFQAQALAWNQTYPRANRDLVLVGGRPAGRLYVDRATALRRLHVIDITLLPEYRGRGVGTALFHRLFREADDLGWEVSLQADPASRACRLYLGLGFSPVRQSGHRVVLRRAPVGATGHFCTVEPSTKA
jgi:GNAT superfamily N-acetyltransferase